MDPLVDRALAAARARGIDVREHLGNTTYCQRWAVGDALVMRIPRSEFTELAEGDGPFLTGGHVDSPTLARTLFASTTDRQRTIDRGPLARFVDQLELDGITVTLHERPPGHAPTVADVPAIALALAELHTVLGPHGHLVPAHIFVDGDRITFTDPLPSYPNLLGGLGYALPIARSDDEGALLRDVVALAAIAADASLGWDERFVDYFERTVRPVDVAPLLVTLRRRVPAGWIDAAARLAVEHYLPAPGVRPSSRDPRPAVVGTAGLLLTRFDDYAALAVIARPLVDSPSLFDFLAHERAKAIDSFTGPDVNAAFESLVPGLAAIASALGPIARRYGNPPPVELPPIAAPDGSWPELLPLRTLLIDVERLLYPLPDTFAIAGGLIARAHHSLAALADEDHRYMAGRRYVNFVSR